jgi:acylphosphatase
MHSVCKKFWISGRVQGVYFRASAREVARRLGLDGWIRNLPDGRVEALARGSVDALATFERWLAEGPEHAKVSGVASETSQEQPVSGFESR